MHQWTDTFRRLRSALALGLLMTGLLACTGLTQPGSRTASGALTPAAQCAAEGGTWDKDNIRITEGYCAKGTAAKCEAAGGHWQRVCMMGTLACVKPYADAGKACSDGRECAGRRCLLPQGTSPLAVPQATPQRGQCIANDNPCYFGINLENGHAVPTAVAD